MQRVITASLLASILITSVFIQVLGPIVAANQYRLDATAIKLLGESRDDTAQYLKLDAEAQSYGFEVPKPTDTAATSQHGGRLADAYSASLPLDAKQGITYTDTANKIGITVTPQFMTGPGQQIDGDHIVYPAGAHKLVYTLKYNGLKEDIIVPSFSGDQLDYQFELALPSGVEARLDDQGNIGIYSADATLYGDISFGSDEDRAKIDLVREKGAKTNLVATIPAPIVKDATGKEYNDRASFKLGDKITKQGPATQSDVPAEVATKLASQSSRNTYSLEIAAYDLRDLPYPIAIDPTITTTSGSDFGKGNMDGTELDGANNLVKRSGLSGGSVGAWTTSMMGGPRYGTSSQAFNGYLYVMGGISDSRMKSVLYAQINGDGSLGVWQSGNTMPRMTFLSGSAIVSVAGGNYIYTLGGYGSGCTGPNSSCNDVNFAKINADGSLSAWATTASMVNYRLGMSSEGKDGYLYATGGCSDFGAAVAGVTSTGCVSNNNSVEFSKPNSDGTIPLVGVGSWTATTTMPASLYGHSTVIHNGKLYVIGGVLDDTGNVSSAIYFATINAGNGSIGAWSTSTLGLPSSMYFGGAAVISGKLYIYGGVIAEIASSRVIYSDFDGTGNITGWVATTNLPYANYAFSLAISNNYIYINGGSTGNNRVTGKVISATVNGDASINSWNTVTTLTSSRMFHASGVANGYFYVWGGSGHNGDNLSYAKLNSDGSLGKWQEGSRMISVRTTIYGGLYNGALYACGGVNINSCEFAKLNSDGSVAAWQLTTGLPRSTLHGSGVIYNGYFYILGGVVPDTVGNKLVAETIFSKLNGDGSLGPWSTTTSFVTKRVYMSVSASNGYLYMAGGCTDSVTNPGTCQTRLGDVQIATLDSSTGTIISWSASTSLPTLSSNASIGVYNGHLYLAGGRNSLYVTRVIYAPIYANGSLGAWADTTSLPEVVGSASVAFLDNYILVSGGTDSFNNNFNSLSVAKIDPAGITRPFAAGTAFATARSWGTSVYANGYIYVIGGCNVTSDAASCAQVNVLSSVEAAPVNSDGTLGTWVVKSAMPGGRWNHAATAHGGVIYVSGGCSSIVVSTCIYEGTSYYATITNTAGDISWTTNTNANITPRREHTATVANGYLYVIGGYAGSAPISSVEKALIAADGNFGAWAATTSLPGPRNRLSSVTYGGQIYVHGGGSTVGFRGTVAGDGTPTWYTAGDFTVSGSDIKLTAYNGYLYLTRGTTVDSAPINADGTVGTVRANPSLNVSRYPLGIAGVNGYIHVIGGCSSMSGSTCNSPTNTTSTAQVNNGGNGSLVGWNGTTGIPDSGWPIRSAVYAGRVYVQGAGTAVFSNVINANGSLGGVWTPSPNIPDITQGGSSITILNGYLYAQGGKIGGTTVGLVYYMQLGTDGSFAPAWTSAATVPNNHSGNIVTSGSFLYVLTGGNGGGSASVYVARQNSDGSIGAATFCGITWCATTAMPDVRNNTIPLVMKGAMYVMGGIGSAGYSKSVIAASIQLDGQLSSWVTVSNLLEPIASVNPIVVNGYVYIIGGIYGSNQVFTSYEVASVGAGFGQIGEWTRRSNISLANGRYGSANFYYRNNIYNIGGALPSSAPASDSYYTSFNSLARTGTYSRLLDFDKGIRPTKLITRGSKLKGGVANVSYSSTNNSATIFGNTQSSADIGYAGSNGLSLNLGTGRTLSRYLWLSYTIDDSQAASFPDEAGGQSTITDYDLYYTANPESRLKGGRTFTGGTDRGLDAAPR